MATAGNWDAVWALEAAKLAESDAGFEHLPRRSLAAAQKIRDAVVSTLQIDVLEQRDPEVTDEVAESVTALAVTVQLPDTDTAALTSWLGKFG